MGTAKRNAKRNLETFTEYITCIMHRYIKKYLNVRVKDHDLKRLEKRTQEQAKTYCNMLSDLAGNYISLRTIWTATEAEMKGEIRKIRKEGNDTDWRIKNCMIKWLGGIEKEWKAMKGRQPTITIGMQVRLKTFGMVTG